MLIEDQDFLRAIIAAPSGTVHCVEFRLECVVQCERMSGLEQTENEMTAHFTATADPRCGEWLVSVLRVETKAGPLSDQPPLWFEDRLPLPCRLALESQLAQAIAEQEQIDSEADADDDDVDVIDGEGNAILEPRTAEHDDFFGCEETRNG